MPLMSSSFTPGQAQSTVNSFQDKGQRQIAQAELYYFSARAEECKDIAELYLQDKDIYLRLSAGLLYSFSNLTLGNPSAAKGRTEPILRRGDGFLRFRQLSGYGAYAPSHRQTASA